jgi:predicted MFS family arabinose efflux permease
MGCFLCAPLASKFGKRPVWLACSVIFFVCNIWAAVAKNFASLLCARIFATWAGKAMIRLPLSHLVKAF